MTNRSQQVFVFDLQGGASRYFERVSDGHGSRHRSAVDHRPVPFRGFNRIPEQFFPFRANIAQPLFLDIELFRILAWIVKNVQAGVRLRFVDSGVRDFKLITRHLHVVITEGPSPA